MLWATALTKRPKPFILHYDKALSFWGLFFSYRVFCLIGDAESSEGSIWEAMNFASYYKLDNLCAIFDVNRLGQSDPTMFEHDFDAYKRRTEAFGWVNVEVNRLDGTRLKTFVPKILWYVIVTSSVKFQAPYLSIFLRKRSEGGSLGQSGCFLVEMMLIWERNKLEKVYA